MANCLMQLNTCNFPNCGQQFANQYDLTAHIEYTHIPVIEEDVKRKNQNSTASTNGDPQSQMATNLPLSYYSRVFRTAYRPNPIKPEPIKVSFNHYKKRALRERQMLPNQMATRILRDMMARQGRHMTLEEAEKRLMDVDFEECGPENNEVRFRCAIVDCNKRYKSMFALRVHMKINHNVVVSEDAKSLTNYPSEDVKPATPQAVAHAMPQKPQSSNGTSIDSPVTSSTPTSAVSNTSAAPMSQATPLPGVAQNFGNPATNTTSYKCTYCSKRYKTSSGLSNHMMSSHQKISDVQDAPSPQVVEQLISQVRMQRQQQEQNGSDQGQQRPIPAQSTQSQTLASILKSSAHARSFSVTTTQQPIRFTQQHYQVNLDNQPSTGQVLQMQMQHQKRMKQMQEQQAAQAAAQQQQQQQQQMQQGISAQQGPPQQFSSPPMGQLQMGQNVVLNPPQQQTHLHQQQMGPMPTQQQYHQMPPQQHSPYSQQMHHQMVQNSPHHYQQPPPQYQHQQSPQFPPYQQQSPQQHQQHPVPPQPQRSPIPLSQSLPPLNSMTPQQRASMQPMPLPNSVPMHLSPPNQQGYDMMTSPNHGPPMSSQPPPYNM